MASFALSATTGGARKHAWTNIVLCLQLLILNRALNTFYHIVGVGINEDLYHINYMFLRIYMLYLYIYIKSIIIDIDLTLYCHYLESNF